MVRISLIKNEFARTHTSARYYIINHLPLIINH